MFKKFKIVKEYLTAKQLDDIESASIVSWWKSCFSDWQAELQDRHETIIKNREMKRAKLSGYQLVRDNEDSNLEIPYGSMLINTARANLARAIFPTDDRWFDCVPNGRDDIQFATRNYNYMRYVLDEIDYVSSIKKFLDAGLTDGVGCHKIDWKSDVRTIQIPYEEPIYEEKKERVEKVDPYSGELLGYEEIVLPKLVDIKRRYKTDTIKVYNNPEVKNVDITKIFYDKHNSNRYDADIIEETYMSYDYLIDPINKFDNIDKLEGYCNQEHITDVISSDDSSTDSNFGFGRTSENIKVWICYGDCRFSGNDGVVKLLRNYIFVIVDESILVKCEPNPDYISGRKHPYIFWDCFPDPNHPSESLGLLDLVLPMQRHINDTWRMTLDRAEVELFGRYKVLGGVDSQTKSAIASGKGFLAVFKDSNTYESFQPLPSGTNFQIPVQLAEMLKNEMMQIIGVSNTLTGQFNPRKETATAEGIRASALEARMGDILQNLQKPIERSLKTIYEYCKMYMDDVVALRVNEDSNYTIEEYTRDEIEKTSFDFKLKSIGQALNNMQKEEALTKTIQAMSQSPVRNNVDWNMLYKDLLRTFRVNDVDSIIRDQAVIPEEQAHQMAIMFAGQLFNDKNAIQMMMQTPPERIPELLNQMYSMFMQSMSGGNGQQ